MLVFGIALSAELLGLGKQDLGSLGEGSGQRSETGLAHHEVQQLAIGLLAGQDERILTLGLQLGHIAPQGPVAALAGQLLLQLSLAHALGDTVVDAGSVSDEDGGAVMCLSFLQSRDEVLLVGTHSDLSNIDIAISHGDGAQILLAGSLTAVGELSHGTQLSGLGSLTAGVGVHLGIDNTSAPEARTWSRPPKPIS